MSPDLCQGGALTVLAITSKLSMAKWISRQQPFCPCPNSLSNSALRSSPLVITIKALRGVPGAAIGTSNNAPGSVPAPSKGADPIPLDHRTLPAGVTSQLQTLAKLPVDDTDRQRLAYAVFDDLAQIWVSRQPSGYVEALLQSKVNVLKRANGAVHDLLLALGMPRGSKGISKGGHTKAFDKGSRTRVVKHALAILEPHHLVTGMLSSNLIPSY